MSFASFKLLRKSGVPNRFRTINVAGSGTTLYLNSGVSGGVKIVTGGDGAFYVSEDGVAWQAGDVISFWDTKSIAYGNGLFVAVGYVDGGSGKNTAYYSTNGINWTSTSLPALRNWTGITYGNGKFVAISGSDTSLSNIAAYSTDGINWTQTTLPLTTNWSRIAYGGGVFVACNADVPAAYSTDGINWINTPAYTTGGADANKLAYGNGIFVGISGNSSTYDNRVTYSTNGINWNVTTALPLSLEWGDIAYGTIRGVGYFFAVGKNRSTASGTSAAAYSTDGINWTQTILPYTATWDLAIYGNNKFFTYSASGSAPSNSIIETI
jgi:hypothetical protein